MHTLFEHKSNNKTVNTVFFCTFTMKKLKNMNQNSKLFLLDAYALIYRAYYAFIKNPTLELHSIHRDPHSATKLLNSTKLNEKKLRKQSVFRYLL